MTSLCILDNQHIFRVGNYTRFRWGYVLYTLLVHVLEDQCEHTAHGQWQTFDAHSVSSSPLPLTILSEFSQFLFTTKLPDLLDDLPCHLSFIKHAAAHTEINPSVSRVCTQCVCWGEGGVWSWALTLIMFVRVKPLWFYHLKCIPISLVILTLSVGFSQLYKVHSNNHSQEHPFMML